MTIHEGIGVRGSGFKESGVLGLGFEGSIAQGLTCLGF